MSTTQHAQTRMKQRGIPPLIIHWLEAYGEECHDHHGAVVVHFNKRSRRRMERDFGCVPVRRMSEWMGAYAVIGSDGAVVTAGVRWKKLKH